MPLTLVDMLQEVLANDIVELGHLVVPELFWDVRALHCLLHEGGPVEAFEEVMGFDLVEGHCSSLLWVLYQQRIYQVFGVLIFHEFGVTHIVFLYCGVNCVWIACCAFTEWKAETKELVEQTAKTPKVHFEGITIALEDFRSHVVRCSDDRKGLEKGFSSELLSSSQIYKVDFSSIVDD